jgi:nucleoside-diphosphate-sugar epimerase
MDSVTELEDRLSAPRDALVEDLACLEGDVLVIGAGGKLGPSLVRLAARAAAASGRRQRVFAVSRFGGSPDVAEELSAAGATILRADIAEDGVLEKVPDVPNVIYLVGAKFGTSGNEHDTWFTNTYLPGMVAQRFRSSRLVALSTGNVYPLSSVANGGSTEETVPDPVGEYAMSCLGRERILTHFAAENGTPTVLVRLNYAVEMRYGVLLDVAQTVARGEPVDVTMGHVNIVWQGYANEVILRSLLLAQADVSPAILNLTGPEVVPIRWLGEQFGARLGITPTFTGVEADTALLSNAGHCHQTFGYPDISLLEMIDHTARWVARGLPTLSKPTGFQRRDGRF